MATEAPLTLGVEEELLVVDATDGSLTPRAQDVLAHLAPAAREQVDGEMNACQVELNTSVCTTLQEIEEEVVGLRRAVSEAAAAVGCAVVAAGTHPWSSWRGQEVRRSVGRYAEMGEAYRLLADQQVICGVHVHVGVGDRDADVAVMRELRPWLPAMLALSANSPCWEGFDSGYASFRTEVWRRWPTAGFPPDIADAATYDAIVEELVAAEAIPDPTSVYWYLRPSSRYETLEVRACDVPLRVRDSTTLAGLYRGLVWVLAREGAGDGPPHGMPLLEAGMWRAARYGLDDRLLDPRTRRPAPAADVVRALLDIARPGLAHHGDADRVESGVASIMEEGTGAMAQRRWMAEGEDARAVVALMRRAGGTG